MRRSHAWALVLAVIGVCTTVTLAHAFTTTWTDQFGETTYSITGPDTAAVGESLTVVLAVSDPTYPENWVASSWTFKVDGVQQDGGFSIWTTGGAWSRSYLFLYPEPGSHTYTFRAQDLGHGGGHDYAWMEISGTTQILPTTGACCFPDGSCAVLPEADCMQQGGAFQGNDVPCDPNPCPQPPMACCFPDGHCEFVTADACAQTGGVPQGYGSLCDPNPCPQPSMACCFADGHCEMLTADACSVAGGTSQGYGTVCDPNTCPQPPATGACCLDDQGRCEILTEAECIGQGGQYEGDGVGCDPNPCSIVPARPTTWGQIKANYR